MVEIPLVEKFISIAQRCRRERNLSHASRLFMVVQENGLQTHPVLGNYLIPMLVECGGVHEARELFPKLVHRNEHSWTSLIQGCVEHGDFEHALHLSQRMQEASACFSTYTLQALLKACTSLKCLERGKDMHARIVEHGFENDPFLSSSLVNMYAMCVSCEEARHVLLNTPCRDVVTWNALIAGYVEHGEGMRALKCFDTLKREGISPSAVTLACSLKACGDMRALSTGQELHAEVIKGGYEWGLCVDGTLLYLYSKCGKFAEARDVLSGLETRNVICWTSLIAGYAEHGYVKEALSCLQQMQLEGVCPNLMTYTCCVKGCVHVGNTEDAQHLHLEIIKRGYDRDPFIGNSLLDLYGKLGLLEETCKLFDILSIQDIFSWNALISGFFQHGHVLEVLCFFDQMHAESVMANSVTFVFIIRSCCVTQDLQRGQELHIEIVKRGLEKDDCIANSLMDMYMKLGAFEVGLRMFDEQIVHDTVSWTSVIAGYVEYEFVAEAFECLGQMQQKGISPNTVTYVCCLKACTCSQDFTTGCRLHIEVIIRGFDTDSSVLGSVIDMYVECGGLAEAWLVFKELNLHDENTWTAYAGDHGYPEHLSRCLEQMELDQVCPDRNTFICMRRTHGNLWLEDGGYEVHASIIKKGFEKDHYVASALVMLYGKAVSLVEAEQLLNKLSCRNVVSWTALVTAYVHHGQFEKALGCLETMQMDAVSPNGVTLHCALKAAGALGAMSSSQAIHAEMMKKGLETEPSVGNNLVDVYAKCGYLLEAQELLERLPQKDAISWTALITGFACRGDSESVFQLLARMENVGIHVDGVTILSILVVCTHLGLVQKGIMFLDMISREGNFAPQYEHFSCTIDLVARAGQLSNAVLLLEEMPFQPNHVAWTSILGACRKWHDASLGRQVFESLRGLDENKTSAYLLMLDIYKNAHINL